MELKNELPYEAVREILKARQFMETSKLSITEGITIQQKQIAEWATVLKPEIARELSFEADRRNNRHSYVDGYDVWRGEQIAGWIANRAMGKSARELAQY